MSSLEQTILQEVRSIKKGLLALQTVLSTLQEGEWISEKEAAELAGMHPKTLQKLRLGGKTGKWRARPSGKGVQYLKTDISKLFIK